VIVRTAHLAGLESPPDRVEAGLRRIAKDRDLYLLAKRGFGRFRLQAQMRRIDQRGRPAARRRSSSSTSARHRA
jgi:hypothetical protein